MLAILLRALAGAAYLLIGILLTYVATLGVVAYVFISGLGYDGLDFSIPIIVYIFVIAVGTDYNILMATRLREEFQQGVEPHEAARIAIVEGAPAVTAAGVILAGTFGSLLLTGIQLLEEIGAAVARRAPRCPTCWRPASSRHWRRCAASTSGGRTTCTPGP